MSEPVRRFEDFRWEATDLLAYKEEGSAPFKAITRQILFKRDDLQSELRYFEVAPHGFSTLERHEHVHGVLILRGHGRCLNGDYVGPVNTFDLITIAPMTWHQFRADDEPLGFLCMVNVQRDKPQLPAAEDIAGLRKNPAVAAFLDDK